MLDGVVLPPVTSDDPAQITPGVGSAFVFGNEVNPQGSDRGFTGTLHEVRLAAATSVFHAGDFELQPKAVVAVGGNDVRWIGTEDGTARQNEWNVVPASVPADGGKISAVPGETDANRGARTSMIQSVQSGAANSLHWWPAEADMKPTQGWFAHPTDVPKSQAALQGFPAERQKALAQGSTAEIDLGSPQAVDRIALSEHVGNIGVLRIHKFASTVTAQEFRITVTATRAPAFLSNISPYGTLAAVPEPAGDLPLDCSAPLAGTGTRDRPFNPLEQFRQAEISAGATIHVKAGTSCAASDTPFWGYGTTDAPITVTTYGGGAAPVVGGTSLTEAFARLAAQDWVVKDRGGPCQAPRAAPG